MGYLGEIVYYEHEGFCIWLRNFYDERGENKIVITQDILEQLLVFFNVKRGINE